MDKRYFHSRSHSTLPNHNNSHLPPMVPTTKSGPQKYPPSTITMAPRAEDYTEIFGAFRSSSRAPSSIPVLDLPAVSDSLSSSSGPLFDYSEIFSGLNAVDFALPFHELFRPFDHRHDCLSPSHGTADGGASSDEAWTPVGTESLSDDSDPFAFSEKSPRFLNDSSHEPFDSKQFNVSYHKVNPGINPHMPNLTHVAELNAVPGYTCVVDEGTSLRGTGKERPCSNVGDGGSSGVHASSSMSQKYATESMSHRLHDDTGLKSYEGGQKSGRGRSVSMSHVNSNFASVSDTNMRTESSHFPPPTKPPPAPAENEGEFVKLTSGSRSSQKSDLETTESSDSQSFFEMEVDSSSSAAVSAAAMKDVMQKAQAKLNAAKVMMGKKRDGLQNGERLSTKTHENGGEHVKLVREEFISEDTTVQATGNSEPIKKEKSGKDQHVDRQNGTMLGVKTDLDSAVQFNMAPDECISEDYVVQATGGRGIPKIKNSGKERRPRSASQILHVTSAAEQPAAATVKLAGKKHEKNSLFADTAFAATGGAGEWKEATQYYEFVNSDNCSSSVNVSGGSKGAPKCENNDDKYHSDSAEEALVAEKTRRRLRASKAVSRQDYYQKMVKVAQDVHERVSDEHSEANKRQNGMLQGNEKEQKSKPVCKPETNGKLYQVPVAEENIQEDIKKEGGEMRSMNALQKEEIKQEEVGSHHKELNNKMKPHAYHQGGIKEDLGRKEEETTSRGSRESKDGEGRVQATNMRDESEFTSEEFCLEQTLENKLADTHYQQTEKNCRDVKDRKPENTDTLGAMGLQAHESEVIANKKDTQKNQGDKRSMGACEDVLHGDWQERTCESLSRKAEDDRLDGSFDDISEEKLQRLQRAWEIEENENTPKLQVEEAVTGMGSGEVLEKGPEKVLQDCVELEECRKYEEASAKEKQRHCLDEGHKVLAVDDNIQPHAQDVEKLDEAPKHVQRETGSLSAGEQEKSRKIPSVTADKVSEEVKQGITGSSPDTKDPKSSHEATLDEKDLEMGTRTGNVMNRQVEAPRSQKVIPEVVNNGFRTVPLDEEIKKRVAGTADVLIDEKPNEPSATDLGADIRNCEKPVRSVDALNLSEERVCAGNPKPIKGRKEVVESLSAPKLEKNLNGERVEKTTNLEGRQGLFEPVERSRSMPAEAINGYKGHVGKKEFVNNATLERNESTQKKSHLPDATRYAERRGEIFNQNGFSGEEDEKDRDPEQERLRRLEEEREREREREKDRSAVEFAIREARERAYVDARERAERASLEKGTDEARQRAMADARERLEKACAEARERSSADKASEARLRAERAAVERVTAEARQRAIEKAMAERATFEARDRTKRSVSEKYFSEKDVITRQSSMPSTSEMSEATDGESAQRCKARLERHQRTVERVANALAEKNMRDLLVQREQAERTRLAETLDADIKRWSNGKERNLRALLSTLQYILGPDSGWKPIPLTEVITAAAVKRAYRKATLCVHPDKLQQRGATIQQKYISEKVFDLLKDAWNRFNTEER